MPRSRSLRRARSGNPLRDLLTSAKSGNPETIQHKSSKMGMDLNSVYSCGNTLLTKAIVDNEAPSTVEAIIKAGADVDYPNSQGKTALMMAVKARRPDLLTVLIQYSADPKLKTPKRISAISLCFEGKLYSYLEILLRQSMNNVDSMIEHLEEICFFMRLTNNNSKETNKSDFVSPISNMDPRLISSIKNVYDLNLKDMNGSTSLMCAVSCHYDDCVRLLLVAGADVNRINKSKETALTLAMSRSHNPILKDLIRAGALRRHPRGETSTLNFGIFKMILDYLQQHGLFNMLDIYGNTALMYAAERGDKTCIMYAVQIDIEEFIKAKDKSAQCVSDDYDAESVLSTCAANETERNCKNSDEQLMEDVRKYQDNNGTPIIMYAFETGKMLLDSYIQSRVSGSVEYRDADGRTILMNFFKFYYQNSFSKVPQLILNIAQKNTPKCSSSNMSAFQVTYKTIERLFGGKANLRDKWGDSTVIYAIRYCDFLTEEITKLLVGDTQKEQYQDGKTALMIAVSGYNGGSHAYIEPLIGDSCSIQDKDGKTASMYAFINNKLVPYDLLKKLIGDSQNIQDKDRKTALMYAFNNNTLVPHDLLKQMIGDSQYLQDKDWKTALMYEFIHKQKFSEEMIELLAGATPFIQDRGGKTALMYAFEHKQYLTDKSIHKLFGGNIDIRDNCGDSTVIYAIRYCDFLTEEITKLLVGDTQKEQYQDGKTALMIAVSGYNGGSHMYIEPLIGDSCSIHDKDGKTALMYAFMNKKLVPDDLLKQLIGDSQNVQDIDGKTALMYAFIHKKQLSEEMIELLAGETPFIQDKFGKTALMYALKYRKYLTDKSILKLFGGKVDIRDNEGNTTLIYALNSHLNLSEEIISLLVGNRTQEKYQNGQTALMIALQLCNANRKKYRHDHFRNVYTTFSDWEMHWPMNRRRGYFSHQIEGEMSCQHYPEYIARRYLKPLVGDSCRVQDNDGKTALMHAFENTDLVPVDIVKQMIDGSQNLQDKDGKTALIYAFIHKKQVSDEMIELLAGETPFIQDNAGKTALMYAFEYTRYLTSSKIQTLFESKVDIRDNEGNTTLIYALKYGKNLTEEIISLLFGDRVTEKYQNCKTALMIALEFHDTNLQNYHLNRILSLHPSSNREITFFEKFIEGNCSQVNDVMTTPYQSIYIEDHYLKPLIKDSCSIQDNEGKTALMYALIKTKNISENVLLMMIGDSRNIQDIQGRTALMYAFIHKKQLSEELICHLAGETPCMQDNAGKTALMYAFECNQCLTYSSILKLFGGKVNICDNKGKTHLMYALQFYTHMNEEIANLLVGDTHKVQYQHGKTALMIALEHNKNLKSIHHFIQSLIDCSCDVLDSSGRTALMYAMRHSAQLPEHLFEQMIRESQFIQDNEGKTALMYAFQKNHFSNYMILNLFHSDLRNVQDHQGKTALHHAIIHDQTDECIKELILHGSNLEAEDKQKRTPLVLCLELDMLYHASPWMENFLNTKMILKYNPMLRLNLLGKIILLKTIQKELFSLNKLSKNKDIFRLIIVNGIEPFPHLNENMSTFFAILKENMIDVVKYLIANMYLTNEDVMLLRKAKDYLKSNEYQRKHKMLFNGTYLDLRSPHLQHLITEATSQPWPLVKLSFIVVSSAVGHGTNREDRVNRLPLPNPIKDSLMFNTRTALIPVSEWTNIPMVFDPVEYENTRRPRPLLNFWPFGAELVV